MKHEKFIYIFLIAIFFTGMGYLWRIHHENNLKYELFEAGKRAMIKEISHEIKKGYVFHIEDVRFIPRKDKAVNISKARTCQFIVDNCKYEVKIENNNLFVVMADPNCGKNKSVIAGAWDNAK